jgi:hypothetical protein
MSNKSEPRQQAAEVDSLCDGAYGLKAEKSCGISYGTWSGSEPGLGSLKSMSLTHHARQSFQPRMYF